MANDNTNSGPVPERRPYAAPALEDYGAVAKVTQGSGATNGDGGQGMMP